MLTKTGEIPQSLQDSYNCQFEAVSEIRNHVLTFTNLTKIVISSFTDQDELENFVEVIITEDDYAKMFTSTQEKEFYRDMIILHERSEKARTILTNSKGGYSFKSFSAAATSNNADNSDILSTEATNDSQSMISLYFYAHFRI